MLNTENKIKIIIIILKKDLYFLILKRILAINFYTTCRDYKTDIKKGYDAYECWSCRSYRI